MNVDLRKLGRFLMKAEKAYFDGKFQERRADGIEVMSFRDRNFCLEDQRKGEHRFRRIVRKGGCGGQKIWEMAYEGGVNSDLIKYLKFNLKEEVGKINDLLRDARLCGTPKNPFGNCGAMRIDGLEHKGVFIGNLTQFYGDETIVSLLDYKKYGKVDRPQWYSAKYNGGLINI